MSAVPVIAAPDLAGRRTVFDKVLRSVQDRFVRPTALPPDVQKLREDHQTRVLASSTAEDFEEAVNQMLRTLGTSHTGFFHEARPRAAGRIAFAATLTKVETTDGVRWMFQDVHAGGAAANAGIRPGDVLLTLDGKEVAPPESAAFDLGRSYALGIRRSGGSTLQATLDIPGSRERKRPIVVPDQVVRASTLAPGIGLIRISMFPGILGMDVARDITRAVSELGCTRLIVDLRGNTGGGIGCLRLMSHLCPDRRGVGYSVGARLIRSGYDKDQLPRFDGIPSSKLGVVPLIFRFARSGRSIAVFSEGLGTQRHHGHVVLLVNEHSASAAEMVAAFASEYGLATVVGTKTAGRLVGASSFKVGFGYRVALPVAAYFTWQGTSLEGSGVQPDIDEPLSPERLWAGEDSQLSRALAVAR